MWCWNLISPISELCWITINREIRAKKNSQQDWKYSTSSTQFYTVHCVLRVCDTDSWPLLFSSRKFRSWSLMEISAGVFISRLNLAGTQYCIDECWSVLCCVFNLRRIEHLCLIVKNMFWFPESSQKSISDRWWAIHKLYTNFVGMICIALLQLWAEKHSSYRSLRVFREDERRLLYKESRLKLNRLSYTLASLYYVLLPLIWRRYS